MKRAVQFADEGGLTITMTLERVEDVGPAIDFLTDMAGAVWRELVIEDDQVKNYVEANWRSRNRQPESRPAEAAPAHSVKRVPVGGAVHDWSALPKEGTLDAKVLAAARSLGKVDRIAIADDLDLKTITVAQSIGRLRKGNHLEGLEQC